MHITSQWQDASGGFRTVTIATVDHTLQGIEVRRRIAVNRPAETDQGERFLVRSQSTRVPIGIAGKRLWLKSAATQLDVTIALSPEPIGPTAPTPPSGDNSTAIATTEFVQSEIAAFVPWLDAATLAATHFYGTPPPYVDIKCGDGRDQRYQVVADYPVSVVERVPNASFSTLDFWGVAAGAAITGGQCVWSSGTSVNCTQTGLQATAAGGTYEITTIVSAYTSGTLTPTLLTGGTYTATPITSAGTKVSRVVSTLSTSAFRLAGSSFRGTVDEVKFRRVMTNACIVSADGLIWAPVGDINVLAYGVVADGVADDTAALLEAIRIAINLGRKALLPPSTMRVSGPIVDFLGSGKVQIEGDPSRTTIVNEMTAAGRLINIQGRYDSSSTNSIYLTAPAVQGARTLTLSDTSQLTVGADILIKDWSHPIEYMDKIYSDDPSRISTLWGEWNRVKSIDSTTQITLGSQLESALAIKVNLTGTVSTTSGVNIVTGVGTLFLTELILHNYITIPGISTLFLKVRKIVSDTVLWIDIAVTPINATVSGAVATKLGSVVQRLLDRAECDLSGIRFTSNLAVAIPPTNNTVAVLGLRRYTGRDLSFIAAGCAEFTIIKSLRGRLVNYYTEDAGRVGYDSYCITLGAGLKTLFITDAYAMRPRHLVTTITDETDIEPAFVYHTGCHVFEPLVAGYDQHPSGRNFLFANCSCTGADYDVNVVIGFQLRGRNTTMVGCQATACHYGFSLAYGDHNYVNGCLANGCDISLNITGSHHVEVRDFVSLNALTNDVTINCYYPQSTTTPLPDIRVHGRGEGNPSGASVDNLAANWGSDWRLDFRNPDAAVKYDTSIPSSHTHGIIAKTADFSVVANLTCIYRTTGTVTATLPLLASDTGEATYIFTEVSGALTIDGNGAETIDGVASITPTGTVRVKKNGETGAWVTIG